MQFSPEVLIVVGPLLAAAFAGLLQRYIGDRVAMAITTASVGLSLALSIPTLMFWVGSVDPKAFQEVDRKMVPA